MFFLFSKAVHIYHFNLVKIYKNSIQNTAGACPKIADLRLNIIAYLYFFHHDFLLFFKARIDRTAATDATARITNGITFVVSPVFTD